jgi:phage terminase small subunit
MPLTPKQEAFCREYLIDLNGTQAAIRAGYSEKTSQEQSSRLLLNVMVKDFIQSEMDKRAERTEITADYVLNGIKDLTERCIQAAPVIIEGKETGEYKFEANAALKGYELMGKHLKLFTDKSEVTGKNGEALQHEITVKYVE